MDTFLSVYDVDTKADVLMNTGSGKANLLHLFLDGRQSWRDHKNGGKFIINLNNMVGVLFNFFPN